MKITGSIPGWRMYKSFCLVEIRKLISINKELFVENFFLLELQKIVCLESCGGILKPRVKGFFRKPGGVLLDFYGHLVCCLNTKIAYMPDNYIFYYTEFNIFFFPSHTRELHFLRSLPAWQSRQHLYKTDLSIQQITEIALIALALSENKKLKGRYVINKADFRLRVKNLFLIFVLFQLLSHGAGENRNSEVDILSEEVTANFARLLACLSSRLGKTEKQNGCVEPFVKVLEKMLITCGVIELPTFSTKRESNYYLISQNLENFLLNFKQE